MTKLSCVEICAGAGGQSIGLENANFEPEALVEIDTSCCNTLRINRPNWNVIEGDIKIFDGRPFRGVELLSGGVPCPPFSIAGKQLGDCDERDLFPEAIRLVDEIRPRAVMLENVRGFLGAVFEGYRKNLRAQLELLGYKVDWKLLNASYYGVSQLRPRVVIVAVKKDISEYFTWPTPLQHRPKTVGELLYDLIASRGWLSATKWKEQANEIAPTIVGGSKKHGGPDLGPTRARNAWANIGVDGSGIADQPPERNFVGMPKLTVPMVAKIQAFPDSWIFSGRKTSAYRQIGNAFPPPVAQAVAEEISNCLSHKKLFCLAG